MATTATGVINDITKLSQAERVKLFLLAQRNLQARAILFTGRVPLHLSQAEAEEISAETIERVQGISQSTDNLEYGEGKYWVKGAPEGE